MGKLLLLVAVIAVVLLVVALVRSRGKAQHLHGSTADARAAKAAADQAVIGRQGGQGMGQGGVGGGMG